MLLQNQPWAERCHNSGEYTIRLQNLGLTTACSAYESCTLYYYARILYQHASSSNALLCELTYKGTYISPSFCRVVETSVRVPGQPQQQQARALVRPPRTCATRANTSIIAITQRHTNTHNDTHNAHRTMHLASRMPCRAHREHAAATQSNDAHLRAKMFAIEFMARGFCERALPRAHSGG